LYRPCFETKKKKLIGWEPRKKFYFQFPALLCGGGMPTDVKKMVELYTQIFDPVEEETALGDNGNEVEEEREKEQVQEEEEEKEEEEAEERNYSRPRKRARR